MLGEDDQLPALAGLVEHLGLGVLQQLGEPRPLRVGTGSSHALGEDLEVTERGDLRLELGDRLRRGRLVDDLLLEVFELAVGQVVDVLGRLGVVEAASVRSALGVARRAGRSRSSSTRVLEALAAAPKRLVDRLGRGGEPPLQHGEREPDDVAAAALALGLQPVGAVHLLAHVLGDLVA